MSEVYLNPIIKTDIPEFSFQLEEGTIKEDGEGKEEPDFIETHCHWKDCDRDYGTQDDLVKVRKLYFTSQAKLLSTLNKLHPVGGSHITLPGWTNCCRDPANILVQLVH